jgi:hypothetical protein
MPHHHVTGNVYVIWYVFLESIEWSDPSDQFDTLLEYFTCQAHELDGDASMTNDNLSAHTLAKYVKNIE